MSNVGAQNTTASNTPTFVSALVVGMAVAAVYMAVFAVLHGKNRKVYQPRTFLAPDMKRPPELSNSLFGWFKGIVAEPDMRVFEMNGPDAYFFVRFLRFMVMLLVPYWLITWAVLMPLAAVAPTAGLDGLNIFTFGNVGPTVQIRHIGHLAVAVALILYTLYLIYHEYRHFLEVRQAYLNSPAHARLARSRTVLINNLSKDYSSEARLRELASFVPGPIEQVWLPRNVKQMEKIFDARNKECVTLEAGETKLQKLAAKNERKGKSPKGSRSEEGNLIARYVPDKKRPSHRIGTLAGMTFGLLGKKVDTLEYSPRFIREQTELLATERKNLDDCPLANSAFVRFTKQNDAHMFVEMLKDQSGLKMISAASEVVPEDIIWNNLNMSPSMRMIRTAISWGITIFIIIIWLPLVALCGVVSNVQTLCTSVKFLSWLCSLPSAVVGIIQGILPPVLLAILFMLLPIVLRILVKMQGEPRRSDVERKLWSRYWLFQVIHGFLIVAIASGLASALANLGGTISQLPTQLATKFPASSIFFLTFILTVTLSTAAKTLSRAVPFIMTKFAFILRGSTPRKAYAYDYKMDSIALSTTWPPTALLGVIGIVYSCVQPITVGFAAVGFYLLYIAYKYMLIWVCDQPDALETGGLYYPKALSAVFCALYIEEVLLICLFFLSQNLPGYIGGGVIAFMLLLTIVFQIWVERKFRKQYLFLDTAGHPNPHVVDKSGRQATDDQLLQQHAHDAEHSAGEHYGNTTGLHTRAFDPPATWKEMPTVWIANDSLGLGRAETERLRGEEVEASCDFAQMDLKGKVTIERGPPDEAWYGGKTTA